MGIFERPEPTTRQAQPVIKDPEVWSKTKDKIKKVIWQRYLLPAGTLGMSVKWFIKYFAVPKGKDNICMVYNATANKLNKAVWAPLFWLPTIDTLVQDVWRNSWMTDRDKGDNQLHEEVRPYTAVDLTCLQDSPK